MLDLFAHSAGIFKLRGGGGAASVTSVDNQRAGPRRQRGPIRSTALMRGATAPSSSHQCAAHGAAHLIGRHVEQKLVVADAFEYLERLHGEGRQRAGGRSATFDMVIVDPPSFAKSTAEVERALAAYARLARLATGLLTPGGILVMASCSSRVTADAFFDTVTQAARQAGHSLTELRQTGHALDHPITFPEGISSQVPICERRLGNIKRNRLLIISTCDIMSHAHHFSGKALAAFWEQHPRQPTAPLFAGSR